jgi:FHA domain-containing protein
VDAESISVDELLLVLKIAFLVLLYLFIWRIVRSASRDIRAPQESMIISPGEAAPLVRARDQGRLVVLRSPSLPPGQTHTLDSVPLTIGRGARNTIALGDDGFASAEHARFDARPDGVWVEDTGSTNGTFVNGERISGAHRLAAGDVVRVGDTDLRYEP